MSSSFESHLTVTKLYEEALFQELCNNQNPYVTQATLVHRVLRKFLDLAGLSEIPQWNSTADMFREFHTEIGEAYEAKKKNLTLDEQTCVERVLSKDAPHQSELVKFANCWMKHEPVKVCRWFAVDGTLGLHPKFYVSEAFSSSNQKHAAAVRVLYAYIDSPERIKDIVQEAFDRCEGSANRQDDPDLLRLVDLYADNAGLDEVIRVSAARKQYLIKNSAKRQKETAEEESDTPKKKKTKESVEK